MIATITKTLQLQSKSWEAKRLAMMDSRLNTHTTGVARDSQTARPRAVRLVGVTVTWRGGYGTGWVFVTADTTAWLGYREDQGMAGMREIMTTEKHLESRATQGTRLLPGGWNAQGQGLIPTGQENNLAPIKIE